VERKNQTIGRRGPKIVREPVGIQGLAGTQMQGVPRGSAQGEKVFSLGGAATRKPCKELPGHLEKSNARNEAAMDGNPIRGGVSRMTQSVAAKSMYWGSPGGMKLGGRPNGKGKRQGKYPTHRGGKSSDDPREPGQRGVGGEKPKKLAESKKKSLAIWKWRRL